MTETLTTITVNGRDFTHDRATLSHAQIELFCGARVHRVRYRYPSGAEGVLDAGDVLAVCEGLALDVAVLP